ncbi:MAG TPA: ABC transporter substrate-binding protein [Xanthobacteraceae bacterium]|nr:ABC transporter substrate-binding protein [Xanthobacteraceae bacterium]
MPAGEFIKRQGWERPATIGFLGATKHAAWSDFIAPFEHGLRDLGWIAGHNLEIDYRWADDGRGDRYETMAKGFVERGVDVIVTAGTAAVAAAKKATKSIPIVFASAGDPVRTGLVRSLAHPGGNVTGLSNGQTDLAGKRLDLLREAIPGLRTLAIIGNRASHNVRLEMDALQKQARKRKIATVTRDMRRETEIAPAIKGLKGKADALYVCTDPFVTHHRIGINTLAVGAGLPTMHAFRHHIEGGGFMSYGPDFRDLFGGSADIVHRILRGASPADIPVKLEKKCELVINLHTAKALGLKVPKRISRRAVAIR